MKTTHRMFMKQLGVATIATSMPNLVFADDKQKKTLNRDDLIWANLIHLSYNMWQDYTPEKFKTKSYCQNDSDENVANWAQYFHSELTCEQCACAAKQLELRRKGENIQ